MHPSGDSYARGWMLSLTEAEVRLAVVLALVSAQRREVADYVSTYVLRGLAFHLRTQVPAPLGSFDSLP